MVAIKQKGQVENSEFKRGERQGRLGPGPDPRKRKARIQDGF